MTTLVEEENEIEDPYYSNKTLDKKIVVCYSGIRTIKRLYLLHFLFVASSSLSVAASLVVLRTTNLICWISIY